MDTQYSVLLSLYEKERPEYLRESLDSVFCQTLPSDDVVLVEDGRLGDALESVVREYEGRYPQLHVVRYEKNRGLGAALNDGLRHCRHELVARMDTDDICVANRFEKQMAYMESNPGCDIVGGWITEFVGDEDHVVGNRIVPESDEDIRDYMRSRCAFNHMTVMFRKQSVLCAGNYQDWYWNEDYYLWIRMMENGAVFHNIQENLVKVRVGKDMYQRRGGKKYFMSELRLQRYMLGHGIISLPRFLYNVSVRFAVQVVMPNRLRGWVFGTFLHR